MRENFHVNISEQFTVRECIRPSIEGSANMDLYKKMPTKMIAVSYSKTIKRSRLVTVYSYDTGGGGGGGALPYKPIRDVLFSGYHFSA